MFRNYRTYEDLYKYLLFNFLATYFTLPKLISSTGSTAPSAAKVYLHFALAVGFAAYTFWYAFVGMCRFLSYPYSSDGNMPAFMGHVFAITNCVLALEDARDPILKATVWLKQRYYGRSGEVTI